MNKESLSEYISEDKNAKTLLLFGGNMERRQEIITLLQPLQNLSIYGALSEAEGMDKLRALKTVDIVLIGGRYTEEERIRIRAFIKQNHAAIKITEPGYQYPYSNEAIFENVQLLLNSL
jgi:hypothetical protein